MEYQFLYQFYTYYMNGEKNSEQTWEPCDPL